MSLPFVTVVIRSYGRIPQMLELLGAARAQCYPNLEILVIEQTQDGREVFQADFDSARQDPRVRILEYPPLGPSKARNEAFAQARGDVLLFMDDDDLPLGTDWVSAHAANYTDPLCMAVTGREVWSLDEDPTPHESEENYRLCLRYTWLRMPRGRMRHNRRVVGVEAVRGGNASLRRETIERAGGWDEEWYSEEHSLDFRFARCRRPGEYFVFDPTAVHLRRFNIAGGCERRLFPPEGALRAELSYSHRVVRRYYPWRFYACYPAYLWLGFRRAYQHLKEFGAKASVAARVWSLITAYPRILLEVWRGALKTRMRPIPGEARKGAAGAGSGDRWKERGSSAR
jgi:glycosyltransferase involved in cell wall biosynthesis